MAYLILQYNHRRSDGCIYLEFKIQGSMAATRTGDIILQCDNKLWQPVAPTTKFVEGADILEFQVPADLLGKSAEITVYNDILWAGALIL